MRASLHVFACGGGRKMADDADEIRPPFHLEAQDGEAAVGVVKSTRSMLPARASVVVPVEDMGGLYTARGSRPAGKPSADRAKPVVRRQ
jgi:hypothetical protein